MDIFRRWKGKLALMGLIQDIIKARDMKWRFLVLLVIPLLAWNFSFCQKWKPIDVEATSETRALFKSLKKLSKKHTLFGHQHATEYGRGWYNEKDRSDVKSVTGSHPAMG